MRKIALIFPGVGYHCDKPLLYFGKKLALEEGYEIVEVPYKGFERGIKGDPQKMIDAFHLALDQTEEILKVHGISKEDDLLVISKSIGTAVAAAYEKKHELPAQNIYFTPVAETFQFVHPESGIVFHGTADSWADTEKVKKYCQKLRLPCYLTQEANHSMEIGNTCEDILILNKIMGQCQEYLREFKK